MTPLKVLLVTSWGQPQCGIQAHSEMLIAGVRAADPEIEMVPSAETLDPYANVWLLAPPQVLHLNYHRALHSKWVPNVLRAWQVERPMIKIVITFHDTFGESTPDALSLALHDLADAFIVHEPCMGLPKAIYWRQGVPDLPNRFSPWHLNRVTRPILGSVGFDFPWKNYTLMAKLAADCGWGLLLYVPEMSEDREGEICSVNPWVEIRRNALTEEVVAGLHTCDATAFLYTCNNSGTSAAIRLGIAAKKPVIAFSTCRQNRDLLLDPLGHEAVTWVETVEEISAALRGAWAFGRFDSGIVALAEQDSWQQLGRRYAGLYRGLVA